MEALLQISGLEVGFPRPDGGMARALRGVNLSVARGQVVGVLGESGCGKSTLARTLLALLPRVARKSGSVEFEGRELLNLPEREMARVRGARICLIPQDPGQALNPVLRVGEQVAEVLRAHRDWKATRCREEAGLLLKQVRLTDAERPMYDAYPHQLSGGQKQRVVIAQALACEPSLVIADEPTASLDSELESEIIALLNDLRTKSSTSLLFITHNPALLTGIADRVAVMYAGRVVEEAPARSLFSAPRHPYSQALLKCVRSPAVLHSEGMRLPTIAGSPLDAESVALGCSFANRCGERMTGCDAHHPSAIAIEEDLRVECLLYGS